MEQLLDILFLPVGWALRLRDGAMEWLFARPWGLLVPGLPALLVGMLLAGVIGYESMGWDHEVLGLYQQLANKALDKPDVGAAEIYLRKLRLLDPNGMETRYETARLAELKGQRVQASGLMQQLAPADKTGHPRAHFWVAKRLMSEKRTLTTADTQRLMHHLEAALASDQDRQGAHVLLADLQQSRGNRAEASRHLEAVVLDRQDLRLPLAVLYDEMGDVQRARQQRERAIDHFRPKAESDPNDAASAIYWSKAVAMGDDYEAAEKILKDAITKLTPKTYSATKAGPAAKNERAPKTERAPSTSPSRNAGGSDAIAAGEGLLPKGRVNSETPAKTAQATEAEQSHEAGEALTPEEAAARVAQLRRSLADLYVAWFDDLQAKHSTQLKDSLPLLQRAFVLTPDHTDALNRLAAVTGQSVDDAAMVKELMSEYTAGVEVPASVRMLLGTSAAAQQNWDEARKQLEQACREMPEMPVVLNNLAWVLASSKPPQLDRALSLADAAVKIWPRHPEIHATRGTILVKLLRWQDALPDLETALASIPDRPSLHADLATVYEHLGDKEMAEKHRKLAR